MSLNKEKNQMTLKKVCAGWLWFSINKTVLKGMNGSRFYRINDVRFDCKRLNSARLASTDLFEIFKASYMYSNQHKNSTILLGWFWLKFQSLPFAERTSLFTILMKTRKILPQTSWVRLFCSFKVCNLHF